MIEVELFDGLLISFDGRVLERFMWQGMDSKRYHVYQIKKMEIVTDKHGKNNLTLTGKNGQNLWMGLEIPDEALAETQKLVAEVQKAIAQHK